MKFPEKSKMVIGLAVAIFIMVCWEVIFRMKFFNPYVLPSPRTVGNALGEMVSSGEVFDDLGASLSRYFIGFFTGSFAGILFGLFTGRLTLTRRLLSPLFNFLRSIPSVALVPLAIVWFGIGETEKIFIILWGTFFPVWLNTYSGAAAVEDEYIWAAKSLGLRGYKLYTQIHLPRSVPFIVAGVRTSIATGFFALAAAEMDSAFDGIAFRIFYSHQVFRTDKMIAAILVIGFLSLLFDWLFVLIMKWRLKWLRDIIYS